MGHEANGIVEDVGADVRTLNAGDLVVMPFAFSDGTCVYPKSAPEEPWPSTTRSKTPGLDAAFEDVRQKLLAAWRKFPTATGR